MGTVTSFGSSLTFEALFYFRSGNRILTIKKTPITIPAKTLFRDIIDEVRRRCARAGANGFQLAIGRIHSTIQWI